MNQSELIEKVAQATELNHAAAGHAVKAVLNDGNGWKPVLRRGVP